MRRAQKELCSEHDEGILLRRYIKFSRNMKVILRNKGVSGIVALKLEVLRLHQVLVCKLCIVGTRTNRLVLVTVGIFLIRYPIVSHVTIPHDLRRSYCRHETLSYLISSLLLCDKIDILIQAKLRHILRANKQLLTKPNRQF